MQATLNGWIEPGMGHISGERRARQRYGLRMALEYRILGGRDAAASTGTTRDLSSTGIAFEAGRDLAPGSGVELAVQWPVPLDGCVPLKLMVRGRVMRSEAGVAVLKVERCHFRTQRKAAAAGMPLQ